MSSKCLKIETWNKFVKNEKFCNVEITDKVSKVGSSLETEEVTDEWLRILGRISNSTP